MPIVGLAIWASGGASSFLQVLLFFTVLFIAYFFPAKLAWPLVALFAFVYATPLLYDPTALEDVYPARTLGFRRRDGRRDARQCSCSSAACCGPRLASA